MIDVAFCLDTTGSMTDLIEGAKTKIWTIVNTVSTAKPSPVLRIAFVLYRDVGDEYVTQVFDFTSDLETMYSRLRSFQSNGGNDEPEHVNKALYDAVYNLKWTKQGDALKLLFLVGDAPPHMDYTGRLEACAPGVQLTRFELSHHRACTFCRPALH